MSYCNLRQTFEKKHKNLNVGHFLKFMSIFIFGARKTICWISLLECSLVEMEIRFLELSKLSLRDRAMLVPF